MANQSPFDRLRLFPTIGEIEFALYQERASQRHTGLSHQEFDSRIWAKYDKRFGDRQDWMIFRMLVRSECKPHWLPAIENLSKVVCEGLWARSSVVKWGILAVLAHVADGWTSNRLQMRQVLKLDTGDLRPLVLNLPPLPDSKLACEVVRQVCLRLIFKPGNAGPQVNLAMLETALEWCVEWLRTFAPEWSPGGRIFIHINDDSVLAIRDKAVLEELVITVLISGLRQVADGLKELVDLANPERVVALTQNAYDLANNVWDIARHQLRGQLLYCEKLTRAPGTVLSPNAYEKHSSALHVLVQLASYCKEHLRFAALAHLYLKTVRNPDHDKLFAYMNAWRIRQAGLQIDGRRRDESVKNRVQPPRDPRDCDPYFRGIQDDQANDPRWNTLSEKFQVWARILAVGCEPRITALDYDGVDTLKYIAHAAKNNHLTDQTVIRAAYQLTLHYGFMRWAGKLLDALQATQQDLLDFAHHLKRFQQLMPFGMDRKCQELWHQQLKNCWRLLPAAESPLPSEVLVLHEVLLGRSLQMVRAAEGNAASLIALAQNDLINESEGRIASIREPALAARGPATVIPSKVASFLHDLSRTGIGAPVCISIVQLEPDRLHLLACGRNPDGRVQWYSEQINGEGVCPISGLSERLDKLKRAYREWLQLDENGLDELHIDWGTPFENLCLRISAIARDLSADTRWLMLAVDAELAALPWQDLFRRFWDGDRSVLVSLVPSFGWAVTSHERKYAYPDDCHRKLSTDVVQARLQAGLPDLHTLSLKIKKSIRAAPELFRETAIVAGHGQMSESGFTLIEGPDGILTEKHWIALSDYRIIVLHSCYGGHVTPGYLGDFGGLVNFILGGQAKLFCAPVAEVPVEAALKLHEHHGEADGPQEFGLRYLAALEENSVVGLYNLYGLPTECLGRNP